MTAFLRCNGVIHRTRKVIQVDDNGHVGRPCEVSLAPPYPELFASYGASAVTRTSGRGHVAEVINHFIEVVMSTCAVSSKHKDAEHRPLVVGMIFWDLREV